MTENTESNPNPQEVTIPVLEFQARRLLIQRQQGFRRMETRLRADPVIDAELERVGGLGNLLTSDPVDPVALGYMNNIANLNTTFTLEELIPNRNEGIPDLQVMAEQVSSIATAVATLTDQMTDCCSQILQALDKLNSKVDAVEKKIIGKIDKATKKIINETAEETANRVAGESYYRYISTTCFLPTIVIICREASSVKYPRRSQFKLKWDIDPEQITNDLILKLRRKCEAIKTDFYYYGPVRANYVSPDKKIRNVLYVKEENDAVAFLEFAYDLIDQKFERENLSITTGRNRAIFNKRKKPLGDVQPFEQDYNQNFQLHLYRIILQVPGLQRPIKIFQNYMI